MEKLSLYADSSVFNFVYADDAPDLQAITVEFFDEFIANAVYDVYVSDVVPFEINQTKNEAHRQRLLDLINRYPIVLLPTDRNDEIEALATLLIADGVFSEGQANDARHVAAAVAHQIDILISWNFRHLANLNKERLIHQSCQKAGYSHRLRLMTPLEVMKSDDENKDDEVEDSESLD